MAMSRRGTWGARRRGRPVGRILSVVLLVWLIIGALAAAQRHYFSGSEASCTKVSTIVVTVLAGPLNYVGANPKTTCHVPQPSK